MDEVLNALVCILVVLIALVAWRWRWLRAERRALSLPSPEYTARFDDGRASEERDRVYHGRVIRRLLTRAVEGRVEIHWEFLEGFCHRGFVLTAKCRRNDGDWQPLALEPYQDSGSWIECFNYGESRSYVFSVKKGYRFFFGLLREEPDEIVYDQISFSVRKGKFLKEMVEFRRDINDLRAEELRCHRTVHEIRQLGRERFEPEPAAAPKLGRIERLSKRRQEEIEIERYVEEETAKINAKSGWSDERKADANRRLREAVAEDGLED